MPHLRQRSDGVPKDLWVFGLKRRLQFAIWKEIAGRKISKTQAGTLLKKGKTGKIKGFKSKLGKEFDAVAGNQKAEKAEKKIRKKKN